MCDDLVVVPVPPNTSLSTDLPCVVAFSGTRARAGSKRDVPCTLDPRTITTTDRPWSRVTKNSHVHVELPMVDSYVHLGYKVVSMMRWVAAHADPTRVLYLDKDRLDRQTPSSLRAIFARIPAERRCVVGDVMECLTPANQVCCCNNHHYATQYNLSSPYARSPAILWGGAGIGFNRQVLAELVAHPPSHLLPYSDQTLSMWAHRARIPLEQAEWSFRARRWCTTGAMEVVTVDRDHWKCHVGSSRTHAFRPHC